MGLSERSSGPQANSNKLQNHYFRGCAVTFIKETLVPKTLRESKSQRLFKITALNRVRRRASKLSDDDLALTLLLPDLRLWRFWFNWWPSKAGTSKANGYPSVDFLLLYEFRPDFQSHQFNEEDVKRDLSAFDLDPERIRSRFDSKVKEDFEFSIAPFSVWTELKLRIGKWSSLIESDRVVVTNALFALDGISFSSAFIDAAIQLEPTMAEMFELMTFPSDDSAQSAPGTVSESNSAHYVTISETPTQVWKRKWQELSAIVNKAIEEEEAQSHLDAARKVLTVLDKAFAKISSERETGEVILNDLSESWVKINKLLNDADLALGGVDFSKALVKKVKDSVEGATSDERIAILNRVDHFTIRLRDFLKSFTANEKLRAETISGLHEVDAQIAVETSRSNRVQLLKDRNEWNRKNGELEIVATEYAEEIESHAIELIRQLGCDNEVVVSAPVTTDSEEPPRTVTVVPPDVAKPATPDSTFIPALTGSRIAAQHQPLPFKVASPEIAETFPATTETPEKSVSEPTAHQTPPPLLQDRSDPETFSDENGTRCRPIWQSLEQESPALAYQIARAIAELEPTITVPPPALLKAVALAGTIQFSHSDVARELAHAYQGLDSSVFNRGPQEWRDALSILLVAGTITPCLVAPSTGATTFISYARTTSQPLHELRKIVVEAGYRLQGLTLGPATFRQVGGMAEWKHEWKLFQIDLADWKKRATRFTLKFSRANDVWKHLISPKGQINNFLLQLEEQRANGTDDVLHMISKLSEPQELRKMIHAIDRQLVGGRHVSDIQAGALVQLLEHTGDALELAQRWADLVGRMPQEGNFVFKTLENLRQQFSRVRNELAQELDTLAGTPSTWGLVRAAVPSLRSALSNLGELLAGTQQVADRKSDPRRMLTLPLLHARSISIDSDWNPTETPTEVLQACVELLNSPQDWQRTFEIRLSQGDTWACREILNELDESADLRIDMLRTKFSQGVDALRMELQSSLRDARKELESALAYGYIQEPERGDIDAKLSEIEGQIDEVRQFSVTVAHVANIRDTLRKNKKSRLDEVSAEIKELGLLPGSPDLMRFQRVIENGDVFTAHEYLQQIRAGDAIPEETSLRLDSFRVFFPELSNRIDAFLDRKDIGFQQIKSALLEGKSLDCLSFDKVAREQRETARQMLDAWFALKRSPDGSGTATSIRDVITGLGFSAAKSTIRSQSRDKREADVISQVISDRNICPVPFFGSQAQGRYRAIFVWGKPADEDLPRIVGESASSQPTIVFYLGRLRERQRRELARVTRSTGASFLVVDEILMLHLCTEPGSRLSTFFACALPFSSVKPFVTTSGLVPPEMFFGRGEALKAVTDRNGRCFVYGGRQLGKTALLRTAERTFHQPANRQFATWIDLKAAGIGSAVEVENIWSIIHRKLIESDKVFFADLPDPSSGRRQEGIDPFLAELKRRLLPERGTRLLLLLDEADKFLEQDSRKLYYETGRLKNLMESTDRGFKVVFAGLHNVLRTTEQANHPLAHFGDPIEIGPFTGPSEWNEARNMIRGPLLAAGYQLISDDLIVRILAQTNYYPVSIQLYGEQLIRILHDSNRQRFDVSAGPRYPVSDALVDEAYRERSLREAIRSRFQYTLQLDQRYEVIAYALAWALADRSTSFSAGASATDLRGWASYWWSEGFRGVGDHEFRILLEEMVGLGVLRRIEERAYSLRNPNLLRLLGNNEDIETVLTRTRETPVEFEPSIFRAPPPEGVSDPRRSPITLTQESSLFADKHGVSLIVGTNAGGLRELKHFLTGRDLAVQWHGDIPNLNDYLKLLDARRDERNTILVLSPEVPWNELWINKALEKIRKLTSKDRRLRIVFVADPSALWHLIPSISDFEGRGLELIPIKPWHDAFLSQWLEDLHISGNQADMRKELKTLTGNWPGMLLPLPQRCHQFSTLLDSVRISLGRVEIRNQFLEDLALPMGEMRNAIRLLQQFPDETIENLKVLASDFGVTAESIPSRMLWAEHLQIAQRSGKESWRLDPYLDSLLQNTSDA